MVLPTPPDRPRRLAYLGTPDAAVVPLRSLVGAGYEVPLVVTRPDRRRGRGGRSTPSPVKTAALALDLPVTHDVEDLLDADVDLGVVVAFGRILRAPLLEALPLVNLHFSLLPRWRGAAPVERAILAGDEVTGVCLMAVEPDLDTGGIYRRAELAIGPDETADELRSRMVEVGTGLLLGALAEGFGAAEPQEGEATYAAKIDPSERELRWTDEALQLHRVVRIGDAWTTFRGRRLKVWGTVVRLDRSDLAPGVLDLAPGGTVAVGTGSCALELQEVQPEGRARQAAADWMRGARPTSGEQLGS